MDEKRNPEQEEGFAPPEQALMPEILELSFESAPSEVAPAEESPAEDTPLEPLPEEAVPTGEEPSAEEDAAEDAPAEEILEDVEPAEELPAEEPVVMEAPVEESPAEEALSEESVPEDVPHKEPLSPETEESNPLLLPETSPEITAHHEAMDFHGLLEHGEEEPPFDLSILDDPEFSHEEAEHQEDEPSAEELLDQEYSDRSGDFEEVFSTEEAPPAPPTIHPARKGRPKRKKGEGLLGIPNILATVVWLGLILAIGVTLGRMLWVCAADVLAFGREDRVVTLTIYESDTMEDIVDKLYDNGLIRYKGLFNLYASISDAEEEIRPGIYDLNTRYDYHALVNFMSPTSTREVVEVMIPEGYTCRQIFALLEENKVCTAVDLAAYAATGELDDYWFLQDVERGDMYCLEGFLFPDTYEFYKNDSPRNILQKMLNNFDYRFSEEMQARIDVLNDKVTGGTFTIREVVIVASLIEKETAGAKESPTIASVIYNRLFDWGTTPAYLNIDASIIYAQGGESDVIDTKLDSPYNTYTNIGLPPTPIANPGLDSLRAALYPADTNYYYYVLNPATWSHQFSTTLAEHERYRAQFAAASEG